MIVMDRVRAGLTGLGLVFLFTLGASAVFGPEPTPDTPKEASEPLAQLGVAPGSDGTRDDGEPTAPATAGPTSSGVPAEALARSELGHGRPVDI